MPKMKTHKGTAKRMKLTGSGKVVRRRAFKNHMLSKRARVENDELIPLQPLKVQWLKILNEHWE